MRSTDVFCYLIVATLAVLSTLGRAESDDEAHTIRPCNTSELILSQCGKNQRCHVSSNGQQLCDCQRGFDFVHGECVRATSTVVDVLYTTLKPEQRTESGGSSVAAGLLIPTFLIVVGVLLYFGARRYKWVQRFRQYRHNRYGNVIVTRDDDDDDDPPIA
ncbi:PREDICTED: uncharacterized protein LOC105458413 [Wasmannia auropunctata]|uniref:uncharacterized protein LOC105458413 n=1 Tax=Wasmannia auropunctata TaxID=64793 RepID=UPI0005EE00AD|nr:PREDICTED: uncharacterized protein LOC105458413 [Wasmannia auropunctata]